MTEHNGKMDVTFEIHIPDLFTLHLPCTPFTSPHPSSLSLHIILFLSICFTQSRTGLFHYSFNFIRSLPVLALSLHLALLSHLFLAISESHCFSVAFTLNGGAFGDGWRGQRGDRWLRQKDNEQEHFLGSYPREARLKRPYLAWFEKEVSRR